MHRVLLSNLVAGKVLAYAVYAPTGELLLPKGTQVTDRLRLVLDAWGISEVYVEDDGAPTPAQAPETVVIPETVKRTYSEAVDLLAQAMETLRLGHPIPVGEVGRTCGELVLKLASEPGALMYLHLLRYRDDYTYQHSIKVGVLAALLGKWLKLSARELFQVAVAGALHDVGKAFVPLEILNKPGRLSPDEFSVVKTHSLFGYQLLSPEYGPEAIPPRVALEHHERMDGSGYPQGLSGNGTLLASRIVAVADIYDAMTSDRVYRARQPGYAVLAELQEKSFSLLDPRVTRTFVERVVHQTQGRRVRLSNGQVGRVAFVREEDPKRPIVAVGRQLIDLARQRDLSLEREERG